MKAMGRIASVFLLTVAGLAVCYGVLLFLAFLVSGPVHR